MSINKALNYRHLKILKKGGKRMKKEETNIDQLSLFDVID